MSWPSNELPSRLPDTRGLIGAGRPPGEGANGNGSAPPGRSAPKSRGRLPLRLLVGALSAILLIGGAFHIGPDIKAGFHDGARGTWVATGSQCRSGKGCVWHGKFVLPSGRVLVSNVGYDGDTPGIHVGTSVAGIYPGGGLVFPTSGSDLWISLLIGMLLGLLGLYWACHRFVADFIRERRSSALLVRLPPS